LWRGYYRQRETDAHLYSAAHAPKNQLAVGNIQLAKANAVGRMQLAKKQYLVCYLTLVVIKKRLPKNWKPLSQKKYFTQY
jgi:hypothetical protein